MKFLIVGLLVAGIALIGLGLASMRSGSSPDVQAGGELPAAIGVVILAFDVILLLVWLLFKA